MIIVVPVDIIDSGSELLPGITEGIFLGFEPAVTEDPFIEMSVKDFLSRGVRATPTIPVLGG